MYDDSYKPLAKETLEKLIEQSALLLGRLDQDLFRRLIEIVDEPRPDISPQEASNVASEAVGAVRQAITSLNKLAFLLP